MSIQELWQRWMRMLHLIRATTYHLPRNSVNSKTATATLLQWCSWISQNQTKRKETRSISKTDPMRRKPIRIVAIVMLIIMGGMFHYQELMLCSKLIKDTRCRNHHNPNLKEKHPARLSEMLARYRFKHSLRIQIFQ